MTAAPRVLQVITGLGTGGAEQQLRLLLRHLPYACDVVTLTNPGPVADGLRADGIAVTDLGMRGNRDLAALPRLVRLIRDGGYDLVHTHLYRACVYGRIAARLAGVRAVVATEHSLGDREIEGRPLTRGTRALYRGTERLGAATVAVSDTVAARLAGWGVPPERTHTVPNGIDARQFRFDPAARSAVRAGLGVAPDAYLLGGVGRLVPGKGFDALIRTAAAVPAVTVVIAGDGPEGPALERLAAELGVADRVRFLGDCAPGPAPGGGPAVRSGPGGCGPVAGHAEGGGPAGLGGSADTYPGAAVTTEPGGVRAGGPDGGVRAAGAPVSAPAAGAGPGGTGEPGTPAAAAALPAGGTEAGDAAATGAPAGSGPPAGPGLRFTVPDVLSAVDAFVSASRDEAFGLAVVEALAAGLPVLYRTCPAVQDLPPELVPGAVRFGHDDASLTAAVRELAARRPPRSRTAPGGVGHYDIRRTAGLVAEVYERVLAGDRPYPPDPRGRNLPRQKTETDPTERVHR
ncbi:glycosyltransferase [Streptomyces sp. NPDC094448]|uniref:glycosyltransferase n=1 Tax=Streptomyces sp. NPDC094448 TaxID=3366063 RepID=UPI00382771A9